MAQNVSSTYKQSIAPLQRKDLFDYFPVAYAAFPGYVRQEVFRVKLKQVLNGALEESRLERLPSSAGVTRMQSYLNNRGNTATLIPPEGGFYTDTYCSSKPATTHATPVGSSTPYSMETFRYKVLLLTEAMEWRPPSAMKDYATELRAQSHSYMWAIAGSAANHAAGKAIGKGIGAAAAKVDKLTPKTKAGQTAQKFAQMSMTTYSKESTVKIMKKDVTVGFYEFNAAEKVAEAGKDSLLGKVFNAEGVRVEMSNDYNKAWLMKHGMTEGTAEFLMNGGNLSSDKNAAELAARYGIQPGLAKFILLSVDAMLQVMPAGALIRHFGVAGTLDLASDFVPVAAATKAVLEIVFNIVMACQTGSAANAAEKTQRHFTELWREFTAKLKAKIRQDLNILTDKELADLCKLLEIKI